MKVKDIMSKTPVYVTPEQDLNVVAKKMDENDIGAIPVVESRETLKIVGVVTDRDIVTRCVAQQVNPMMVRASEIMSTPVVTIDEEEDVEVAARTMEKNMIRRIPVVDKMGKFTGVVSQADIALKANDKTTAGVVHSVSKPTEESSKVNK